MDNTPTPTPTPTNQPNETGNETPEIPTTPTPDVSPATTPEAPQEPAAPVATPTETAETTETIATVEPTVTEPAPATTTTEVTETTEVAETVVPAPSTEAPETPAAPVATEPTVSEPTPTPTPTVSEPQPITTPAAEPAATPAPIIDKTPTTSATGAKKANLSVGLIIGFAIGGVLLLGGIVTAVVLLLSGSKVDYVATYRSFDALETSMNDIDYGDCYKVHSHIDSSYTTSSEYSDYIAGCVEEFVALESATSEFGKSSGAKHDADIKKAYEAFKSNLNSIYTKKSDLESQLSIYNTFHEFYLTIENSSTDVKSLESAIIAAASLLEDTKNPALTEFAKGFREKGLAYVRAIDDYRNSSGVSYSDVYDKMDDFTDYIENHAPEIDDITSLDFTKMNDLSSAYYDLRDVVRSAYYEHIR